MAKFQKLGDRKRVQQDFDRKNIFYVKCGKKINVYDEIQANNEDIDIYKTLEKYGSLERMQVNKQALADEFLKTMDLRDVMEQQEKFNNMFANLPYDIREQFNNDVKTFARKGEKWLGDFIKKNTIEQQEIKIETKEEVKQ